MVKPIRTDTTVGVDLKSESYKLLKGQVCRIDLKSETVFICTGGVGTVKCRAGTDEYIIEDVCVFPAQTIEVACTEGKLTFALVGFA